MYFVEYISEYDCIVLCLKSCAYFSIFVCFVLQFCNFVGIFIFAKMQTNVLYTLLDEEYLFRKLNRSA